jgi:hypothetical protein
MKKSIFMSSIERISNKFILLAIAVVLTFASSCTTDEDPAADDKDKNETAVATQNTIVIGQEVVPVSDAGWQNYTLYVRGTAATNSLNLGTINLLFTLDDTGNTLHAPDPGTYTIVDGLTTLQKGTASLQILISNNKLTFYISLAGGEVKVSKDSEGYYSYELTGVKIRRTDAPNESIAIAANLGGKP